MKEKELSSADAEQQKIRLQSVARSFSGPLPPPELLGRYNEVAPGAAERILAMAESQQRHRQELEKTLVDVNIDAQRLGSVLGFLVAMTAIVGGIYLVAVGRSASGLAAILTTLTALVGVFVYGKHTQKSELAEKSNVISQRKR